MRAVVAIVCFFSASAAQAGVEQWRCHTHGQRFVMEIDRAAGILARVRYGGRSYALKELTKGVFEDFTVTIRPPGRQAINLTFYPMEDLPRRRCAPLNAEARKLDRKLRAEWKPFEWYACRRQGRSFLMVIDPNLQAAERVRWRGRWFKAKPGRYGWGGQWYPSTIRSQGREILFFYEPRHDLKARICRPANTPARRAAAEIRREQAAQAKDSE